MNVQELYQKKLTSAETAVKCVKSGDWVDYGWCTNHPYTLDKALAARQSELRDVKVRGGVTMWMPEICKAEDAGEHFTWHSWHCSGIDRKIIAKGMGYFSPMRYSELPRFYRESDEASEFWEFCMADAEQSYHFLLEKGLKPEDARKILPNSTATHIVMKTNIREWRHIFSLRLGKGVYPEMRELMELL